MITWQRYKSLFIENSKIVIGAAGSLLVFLIIFLPTVIRLPENFQRVGQEKEKLVLVSERLKIINNLVSLQQSLKSSLSLADKALPSREEVPILMTQIQALATESGVLLKTLQFGGISKATEAGHKKISLQAMLEGSYVNLTSFLKNLEKTSRIIDVETVSFDSRKNQENLSASLGLSAYFLEKETTKIGPTGVALTFTSQSGLETLNYLKTLRVYEPQTEPATVGKSNPFE